MKNYFKKILSLCLCLMMILTMGFANIVYAAEEESEDFCKIKRTTVTVTIMPFEKLDLYAEYNIKSDEDYELLWTIDGKSYFVNDGIDKTGSGTDVELLFLDDTTVKLQIIASNGEVLCEDEMFLKSYRNNDVSFWVNLQGNFLLAIMLFIGIIGGTFGPWIGSLFS